eukprot:3593295-Rhodomonas_salina.3
MGMIVVVAAVMMMVKAHYHTMSWICIHAKAGVGPRTCSATLSALSEAHACSSAVLLVFAFETCRSVQQIVISMSGLIRNMVRHDPSDGGIPHSSYASEPALAAARFCSRARFDPTLQPPPAPLRHSRHFPRSPKQGHPSCVCPRTLS